jgi:nitrate reductase molybdenum cofactor assembly chaperone
MEGIDWFTPLFAYPDAEYRARAEACARETDCEPLRQFAAQLGTLSMGEIQERFVQAFDLNPASTLEIGWHLFGEQYERGEFLVSVRKKLREAAIAETGELPDHLLHVLPLLARLPRDDGRAFADRFLLPAVEKIKAGLAADSVFVALVAGLAEYVGRSGPKALTAESTERTEVRG